MTRLPELEHELVAAAARLGHRPSQLGRGVRLAAPVAALIGVVALVLLVAGVVDNEDEGGGSRPASALPFHDDATLEEMLAVFRRPATPRDDTGASNRDLEASGDRQPGEDVSRSRRVDVAGATGFLWPMTNGVCYSFGPRSGHGSFSSCVRLDELRRQGISFGFGGSQGTFGVGGVAVDGVGSVRLARRGGIDITVPIRENAFFIDASVPHGSVRKLRWRYAGKERSFNLGRVVDQNLVPPVPVPPDATTPDAPVPDVKPLAGSLSEPLEFTVNGTRYTAVGFKTRQSSLCAELDDGQAAHPGVGCLNERLLRAALEKRPAHIFATGGSRPGLVQTGFARRDVLHLAPADALDDTTIVLSPPWRPRSWKGEPIRFFFAFLGGSSRPAPGRVHQTPLAARLRDGRTVQIR